MHKFYNPNPLAARVGDCTVRAISKALEEDWSYTYINLCLYGLIRADMPSANSVWGKYLRDRGFVRYALPFRDRYTVSDFCDEHKKGIYILALNGHVVCVIDGDYYDTWDSGNELPVYYWTKEG